MSDGMGREPAYLSSHATNRYFIPNWGNGFSKSANIDEWHISFCETHSTKVSIGLYIDFDPSKVGILSINSQISFSFIRIIVLKQIRVLHGCYCHYHIGSEDSTI